MHKVLSALFISSCLLFSSACTLYTSSDRKKFETDTAALNLTQKINNLVQTKCSPTSIASQAQASKLVNILNTDDQSQGGSVFLWEHIVNNTSVFETANLEGVYCLYE